MAITLNETAMAAARAAYNDRGAPTFRVLSEAIRAYLAALSSCRIGEETKEAPAELSAGLCPRCAGTGRDPSTTSLQCYKCMGQGAVVLRASLSRKTAGEATGWQTMETAPKDGTHFLAYERNGAPDQYPCWFVNDQYEGAFWQNDYDSEPDPSHWRPLASPPSDTEEKGL